nr:60S ribosomal protein L28-1-like [Coffea arabica]
MLVFLRVADFVHVNLQRPCDSTVPEVTLAGQCAALASHVAEAWDQLCHQHPELIRSARSGEAQRFSSGPNNLCNLHSYKHFGLANKKTVTIQPGGKDQSVLLATTKTKKQNRPAALYNKSVMKKEFRRMAKAVTNQVADNRPDLKKAALIP